MQKHSEIDAIVYCPNCSKYYYNKCQNYHSEILNDHQTISLNNPNEIFIDICQENNHINKLEFYCKKKKDMDNIQIVMYAILKI